MKAPSKLHSENLRLFLFSFLTFLFISQLNFSQSEGKKLFEENCSDCHSIGEGVVVGPDLKNITQKRTETWLIKFIKSPGAIIDRGDKEAKKLFEEFDEEYMPDQDLTELEIKNILEFIKQKSSGTTETVVQTGLTSSSGISIDETGKNEIKKGAKLFSGTVAFENGATACISCHNVTYKNFTAGGSLAKDLTKEFSRLKPENIAGIIASPPFPVMKAAYKGKPVTKDEAFYITAFLKDVNAKSAKLTPVNYAHSLLLGGIIGTLFLMGLFALIWKGRKTKSVNQSILDRQAN